MKFTTGEYEVIDRGGAIHYVKMEGVDQGIVGVITNHSWLDNPTFKGMRKSLQDTFDQIYVFDLHGNAKKKEVAPDAAKNENVFDIEQGVAISLFIRKPGLPKGVFHADLWGKRLSKYRATTTLDLKSVNWTSLEPANPSWLFKPQNEQLKAEYDTYPAIPHIFGAFGGPAPGFVTTHDDFAISFTAAEAKDKIKQFLKTESEAEARRLFKLCSQSQWSYAKAKKELPEIALCVSTVKATYRPFDDRWTVWDRNVNVHRRERVNNHLLVDNIALITHRTTKDAPQPFVTCNPAAHKAATRYDISYVAPLMEQGRETFSIDFRRFIDDLYERHYSPWEIFGYIYAVLSAPAYQKRYDEFLRTDFPRIPFTQESRHFDVLSALGWELAQAHLLQFLPSSGQRLGDYVDLRPGDLRGEHRIEDVFYSPEEETVWINKDRTLGFANLPEAVWRFQVGGYQVLDKYLKSRKDRCLNLDEQTHVGETAEALHFTINQTVHIDIAYRAAFSHLVE